MFRRILRSLVSWLLGVLGATGRARTFFNRVRHHLTEGSLLDLGAGSGHIALEAKCQTGKAVSMLDVEPSWSYFGMKAFGLPSARGVSQRGGIPYFLYDGQTLPDGLGRFDNVLLAFVLHHAKDMGRLLNLLEGLIEDGGRAIIIEDTPEGQKAQARMGRLDVIMNLEPGGHAHENKTAFEWRAVFEARGWSVTFEESFSSRFLFWRLPHTIFVLER